MDALLTTLLNPTPFLTSWFTWLKPSTARRRIAHDRAHFGNLIFATNYNPDIIPVVDPYELWIQELQIAEAFGFTGFGPRVNLRRREAEAEAEAEAERRSTAVACATAAARARTTARKTSKPEEEAKRYQERELQRRKVQEANRGKKRGAQREKRERIARENKRGILADKEDHDADRSWVRSRRAAWERKGGRNENAGSGSVWGVVPKTGLGSTLGLHKEMEAVWGEMPALGGSTKINIEV